MAKEGYVVLISVLVFTVIGSILALSATTLGIMSTQNNDAYIYGAQAKTIANGCAETVLQEIRDNINFSGLGSESIGGGTCEYNVVVVSGNSRRIEVSANYRDYNYGVEINVDALNPTINVTSWQEVNAD